MSAAGNELLAQIDAKRKRALAAALRQRRTAHDDINPRPPGVVAKERVEDARLTAMELMLMGVIAVMEVGGKPFDVAVSPAHETRVEEAYLTYWDLVVELIEADAEVPDVKAAIIHHTVKT